ncbi:MAG: ribonucleotide-diphosphate reductase [Planctomycetota bacterium]|nr:MAG: ribonucleotide-diphosphate reductase [Planctomycetota bacterium]
MARSAPAGTRYRAGHRLDPQSPVLRLWHKAKQLGTWDPRSLDFRRDAAHWQERTEREQDATLRLLALFLGGEESVALDLVPLIWAVAREGRLEEEMFLAAFLWEEAKHVEAFHRFLDEVTGEPGDLGRYFTPSYQRLFGEELPRAMGQLLADPSPPAQAEASVTYHMFVEGVLAETGYHAFFEALTRQGLFPGLREMITLVQRDESRHIAYGVHLLSRLVAEHGDPVWAAIERRMHELLPLAHGLIVESLSPYGDDIPYGLDLQTYLTIAQQQFERRYRRIERARRQTLAEIDQLALEGEEL